MLNVTLLTSLTLLVFATTAALMAKRTNAAMTFVAVAALALGISACSASSSGSDSSGAQPSPSTTSQAGDVSCTSTAILAALPGGAEMKSYDCAQVGVTEWAAARVAPGNTVFFLKSDGSAWQAMTADSVCGTASAGLPTSLLSYCATPSSSPSASPAGTTCSSKAILAALPGGAEMKSYDCAQVGDTEWAAARVAPGNTVFFLKSDGSAWQAMTADSVCGTASAGLPTSLLSYCKA
ncbi:hypothetical protein [Nocardioides sp.]|uniref:hypothetical protein n=1 Tax=Nocardioides sp. TaxID=35761 RepID=UPI003D09706F